MKCIAVLVVLAAFIAVSLATIGVDVSQPTSQSAFQCMRNNGYNFAVVRAYESIGRPDYNAPATVANAWAGGMAHVDVYMFPCPHCSASAADQVNSAISYLHSHGVRYGMFWLDIEGPQYWRDRNFNIAFIDQAIQAVKNAGQHVGIYTSESQWSPITGNWAGAASVPLWYAHYDGSESFGDFRPFAGWSRPSIKQFRGDITLCGAGVDANWYP